MKYCKKIIGSILILTLSITLAPASLAQTSRAEESCVSKKPDYIKLMEDWNGEKTKDNKAYKKHFDIAREAHHNYVSCMFSFAEQEILQTEAIHQGGTYEANTPNQDTFDWMAPDQACLTPNELKWVIQGTDPSQMLQPMLNSHNAYKLHLNAIGDSYRGKAVATDENGRRLQGAEALIAFANTLGSIERQRRLEIESSLVAIDLMFTSLKELRLSFVMHVHFQCMLKYLEEYRIRLENLRKLIQPLPALLRDASTTN
ncbi:MAG: hypothetical protein OEY44_02535 [Candidatus Peregrinibacteria bacterium]|nr:hypothetical protein [Candidatus Peregrinibacteria bacterium]